MSNNKRDCKESDLGRYTSEGDGLGEEIYCCLNCGLKFGDTLQFLLHITKQKDEK